MTNLLITTILIGFGVGCVMKLISVAVSAETATQKCKAEDQRLKRIKAMCLVPRHPLYKDWQQSQLEMLDGITPDPLLVGLPTFRAAATLCEAVRAYIAAVDNPLPNYPTCADRHLNTLRELVDMPRKQIPGAPS